LGNDKFAALEFPLPKDADYVFFKPDDQDRFVKLDGAFADTYPLLPGDQSTQVMTSYLVPYSGKRVYTYTAPVDMARINFIVPHQANTSLTGSGLVGPEATTLEDGAEYQVYSYTDLKAGETLSVTLSGTTDIVQTDNNTDNLIAIGIAFLGFVIIGVGVWRWRRPENIDDENETNAGSDEPALDDLIAEIARLDETYEQQGLSSEEYQNQRQILMQRAKLFLSS
jgi:hypothetical protein